MTMQKQSNSNPIEAFYLKNHSKLERVKNNSEVWQQLQKIFHSLEHLEQKISDLKNNSHHLNKTEIETYILQFFKFPELKEEVLSFIFSQLSFHQYLKQNKQSSCKTQSSIYEIPVELHPLKAESSCDHYENPSTNSQNLGSIEEFLDKIDTFSQIPKELQNFFYKIQKLNRKKLSLQTNQFNIQYKSINTEKIEHLKTIDEQKQSKSWISQKRISDFQTSKQIEQIDRSVKKIEIIMESLPNTSPFCDKKNNEENTTTQMAVAIDTNKVQKYQIYYEIETHSQGNQKKKQVKKKLDLPRQMSVIQQSKQIFQTQEIKNDKDKLKQKIEDNEKDEQSMSRFEVSVKPIEKIVEDKKLKKKKSISGNYLSASVESVVYGFGQNEDSDEELPKTPVSNQAVADWEHPELDFIDSQDIGQSKSHNLNIYDSLGTSQAHKIPGDFKESCINEKPEKKVVQIFQTVNLKSNNPIFIIAASDTQSEVSKSDQEMYMSELKEKSPHMNLNLKQNTIKEVTFQASEYYDLKDKLYASQEEKIQLSQRLKFCEDQIQQLRQQISKKRVVPCEIEEQGKILQWDEVQSIYEEQKKQLQKLKKVKKFQQGQANQLKQENRILQEQIRFLSKKSIAEKQKTESLQGDIQKIEKYYVKELQKINNQLEEKDLFLKDLEKVSEQKIKQIEEQNKQTQKENFEFISCIDQLNKENQQKKEQIQQLLNQNSELQKKISQLIRNCEIEKSNIKNIKNIYEEELEEIKEDFFNQFERKESHCQKIEYENHRLHKQILQNLEELHFQKKRFEQQNKIIQNLRLQLKKSQGSNNSRKKRSSKESQTQFLRRELQKVEKQIQSKDIKIQELNFQVTNMKKARQIKIIFQGDKKEESLFMNNIKELIVEYQEIIYHHHNIIREFQQRVYEYLEDAIDKEQEANRLYENFISLQGDFHDLMIEKINLELENKKLKNTIRISECRISTIGTKLMLATKDRYENQHLESQQSMKYFLRSKNSTVKIGQM